MRSARMPLVPLGIRNGNTRALVRLTLVLLALVGSVSLATPGAHAHAELTSAAPAEGAVLAGPPATIRLTFTEDLMPAYATLTLAVGDGAPKTLRGKAAGRVLTTTVPTGAPGRWVTAYRVVSVDGHAMTGSVRFTVAAASTPATVTSTPAPSPSDAATGPARTVPPAETGAVLYVAPLAAPAPATSASAGFGSAGGAGWWVASAMCLASAGALALRGRKAS